MVVLALVLVAIPLSRDDLACVLDDAPLRVCALVTSTHLRSVGGDGWFII